MGENDYLSQYNILSITNLLEQGFSIDELRLLWMQPGFGDIKNQITDSKDMNTIISIVVKFAIKRLVIDSLLMWARAKNSKGFEYYGPYSNNEGVSLRGQNLIGADLSKTNISKARFVSVLGIGVNFNGSDFSFSSFDGVIFSNADLSKARIDKTTKLPDSIMIIAISGMSVRDFLDIKCKIEGDTRKPIDYENDLRLTVK